MIYVQVGFSVYFDKWGPLPICIVGGGCVLYFIRDRCNFIYVVTHVWVLFLVKSNKDCLHFLLYVAVFYHMSIMVDFDTLYINQHTDLLLSTLGVMLCPFVPAQAVYVLSRSHLVLLFNVDHGSAYRLLRPKLSKKNTLSETRYHE